MMYANELLAELERMRDNGQDLSELTIVTHGHTYDCDGQDELHEFWPEEIHRHEDELIIR